LLAVFIEKSKKQYSLTVQRRGNAHHRAKHAVTRLPRQRCRRPTPRSCAAGANGTNMCHFTPRKPDILTLPRCSSAESFTSSCKESRRWPCLRRRRGAGLGELQRARGRSECFSTAPVRTSRALYGVHHKLKAREVGETTQLSRSGNMRARHLHFNDPGQICHTEFKNFSSSAPFFSRVLPTSKLLFARDCTPADGPVRLSDGHQVLGGAMR
jgi:hypothetical protein